MTVESKSKLCQAALAGDLETVKTLLANGTDPNESMPADEWQEQDGIEEAAIYFAVRSGNADVFYCILKAGGTCHIDYSLYLCAVDGLLPLFKYLISEGDLKFSGEQSEEVCRYYSYPCSLLGVATRWKHLEMMEYLIEQGVTPRILWPKENLLFNAAVTGSAKIFEFVVSLGFDPATDGRIRPDFFNCGMYADLLEAAIRGNGDQEIPDLELVETILNAGYSPLDRGLQGAGTAEGAATHFERAVSKGHEPLTMLMIRALPAPNELTQEQNDSLFKTARQYPEVMEMLQQAGYCENEKFSFLRIIKYFFG